VQDWTLIATALVLIPSVDPHTSSRGGAFGVLLNLVAPGIAGTEVVHPHALWIARLLVVAWMIQVARGRSFRLAFRRKDPSKSGNPAVRAAAQRRHRNT